MKSLSVIALSLFVLLSGAALADVSSGLRALERGDYETALSVLRQGAAEGDPRAQYHLGQMYDDGKGVEQDDATALDWYTKAATGGYAPAQVRVATIYGIGEGVDRDLVKAHAWYSVALTGSDPTARDFAGLWRLEVSRLMTDEQLAAAKELAEKWRMARR